ncbi:hypothetical protein T484DRAFT_1930813 [Baffinella frigidus]|nr:hypothetical protein T484DRAFT_1930813 [Cryptophyta sp. CCMP2293]
MGFRGSFRCSVVLALAGAALAFRLPTPPLGAPSSARLCTQPGRGRSHRFGINHVVASAARSSRSGAAGKERSKLGQKLSKKSGAVSMLVEYRRDPMLIAHDLSELSAACRENGAVGIVVSFDDEHAAEDLASLVREQRLAKGCFPGPCAVLQRGGGSGLGGAIVAESDVEGAKAAGADGVVIQAAAAREELAVLVRAARETGLEAVVEVSGLDEATAACDAGALILMVRGMDGAGDAVTLRESFASGVVTVAAVPSMQGECQELDDIALFHAAGFNAVMMERGATRVEEAAYLSWLLSSVRSRKSGSFGFEALGINFEDRHETIVERWGRWQQKREPLAWEGWKKFKKTRQYQYIATIWGA